MLDWEALTEAMQENDLKTTVGGSLVSTVGLLGPIREGMQVRCYETVVFLHDGSTDSRYTRICPAHADWHAQHEAVVQEVRS